MIDTHYGEHPLIGIGSALDTETPVRNLKRYDALKKHVDMLGYTFFECSEHLDPEPRSLLLVPFYRRPDDPEDPDKKLRELLSLACATYSQDHIYWITPMSWSGRLLFMIDDFTASKMIHDRAHLWNTMGECLGILRPLLDGPGPKTHRIRCHTPPLEYYVAA